jgi:hypothetical protein
MWWQNLKSCGRSKYILSEIGTEHWLAARLSHCPRGRYDWGCTFPLPFLSNTKSDLNTEFLRITNIHSINVSTLNAVYDAYREFVICAIPQEQLYVLNWQDVDKKNSTMLWSNITKFLDVDLRGASMTSLSTLTPFQNSQTCLIGNTTCQQFRSIPSLCNNFSTHDIKAIKNRTII